MDDSKASLASGASEGAAPAGDARDRLEGWKAIAVHLGRDIRTVQRWEQREALPVHRHEHHKQASAYAYGAELDEWLRRREMAAQDGVEDGLTVVEEPPAAHADGGERPVVGRGRAGARPRRLAAAGLLALVLAAAGWFAWHRLQPNAGATGTRDHEAYTAFAEGQALYNARQYQKAAASLERAVSRDPRFGAAWAVLAKAHARLAPPARAGGEVAAARATEAARRAAELAPNDTDVRVAMALAARARGDLAGWRAEARHAIRLDPRAAEAYALLGDSYSAMVYSCQRDVDAEQADRYYRQALELKPDLSTAITNRATNLRRLGRYAECISLTDAALRTSSDEVPLRFVRGSCRLANGDVEGAAADLEPLRDSPKLSTVSPLVEFGLLSLKRGQTEQGIRDLEVAARIQPGALSEIFVAEAYADAGDIPHVTSHLARAFAQDASCRQFVATSPAFARVQGVPEVRRLLAAR